MWPCGFDSSDRRDASEPLLARGGGCDKRVGLWVPSLRRAFGRFVSSGLIDSRGEESKSGIGAKLAVVDAEIGRLNVEIAVEISVVAVFPFPDEIG